MKMNLKMVVRNILAIIFFGLISGCSNQVETDDGWTKIIREKKVVDNISYFFSSDIEVARRDAAILECQNSIVENLELIGESEFTNEMDIEFVASRDEMQKYTGMGAQGMAFPERNTFFTLLKDEGSPIKHEMMHMISMYKWGTPPMTSTWMNEGLATYAGGICFDYTFEEIYKYFIQSGKLIPMTDLASAFYQNPDMIAYTQSAFISQYLINNFGVEKFRLLWKGGFQEMQTIYGFDDIELEKRLAAFIEEKHPDNIEFDWDDFNEGC